MNSIILGESAKDTVIFLHGWGGDASAFLFCAERLAGEFRCVMPEFAGFGKSGEPERAYTVRDYARDVLDIADGLGAETFVLVGHSFGGRVAVELAAAHGERVRALVLVDAAGLRPRRKPSYFFRVALHKLLKRLGKAGLKGSSDYRALSPVMKATFVNVVNYDQTPQLAHIACPTAVFWGRDDRDTPVYMAKKFLRGIRDSALFMLDGGHFAYLSDPTFFTVLHAFLGGVREGKRVEK